MRLLFVFPLDCLVDWLICIDTEDTGVAPNNRECDQIQNFILTGAAERKPGALRISLHHFVKPLRGKKRQANRSSNNGKETMWPKVSKTAPLSNLIVNV